MDESRKSVVLLPFGQSNWPLGSRCPLYELLEACGGDSSRCFAGMPRGDLNMFVERWRHQIRLCKEERFIVALGKEAMTMSDIVDTRRQLEAEFSFLITRALWLIFFDAEADLASALTVESGGTFSHKGLDEAPVWKPRGTPDRPFIILVPQLSRPACLPLRIQHILTSAFKTTGGYRPSRSSGFTSAVEVPVSTGTSSDKPPRSS